MRAALKKLSYLHFWIVTSITVILFGVYLLYSSTKDNLFQVALQQHHKEIEHDIKTIIDDRRDSSLAIALALAENPNVHRFLCEDCSESERPELDFSKTLEQLDLRTHNGNIGVQIIDSKGVSRYRSWTTNVGDSLKEVRYDVRQMMGSHRIQEGMSVGRFSLTFKSMVPVFSKDQKFLGMLEVVSHLTSLAERLAKIQRISSVILVDKRYKAQLTRADKTRFLNDFYIVNENFKTYDIELLQQFGEAQFTKIVPIQKLNGTVITQYVIEDSLGRLMGYWFAFEDLSTVDLTEVRLLNKQYLYGSVIVSFLSLLLVLIYVLRQKAEEGRKYYRNILNATSEIILVSDHSKIIDANKLFFDFYSEFKDLKAFLKHYECICDTFESGNGFLQKYVDGKYWLDYALDHVDQEHIVKISKDDKPYYFQVKVALVQLSETPLYSIIMHDVTKQELYRMRLEYQAETDPLTGIANRLVFNKKLTEEVTRANRYQNPLCLAVFDMDHFKSINDEFGHDTGDHVLRIVSGEVTSLLRETDIFCRIGGEEFAVIMPETELHDAKMVMERLRASVELLSDGVAAQLSISIGVSRLSRWDSDSSFFKKTDEALYRAKKAGRNRVVVSDEA